MEKRRCCFTGHRVLPAARTTYIRERLTRAVQALVGQEIYEFVAGGALGFDTLAAQVVLEQRALNPQVKLFLVLPCRDQDRFWSLKDKEVYEGIKHQADEIVYICDEFSNSCMLERNRRMVEISGYCICYQTSNVGGTAYTVRYCQKRGVPVLNIA